jgi:glycosyltransferase involved in cell wall biosynthesis
MKGFAEMGALQAVLAGVYETDHVELPGNAVFYPVYFHSDEMPYAIAGMSDEMPYESMRYCDMTDEITETFCSVFRRHLRKAVQEFQPDLIFCHHLYLLTAIVRQEFPDICVMGLTHGSDLRQLRKNPLNRDFIREQIRGLDKVFCLHDAQKAMLREEFSISDEMIEILGTGYNRNIFHRIPVEKRAKGTRLIFAGKISEKKGVMSLIRSMNEIPASVEIELNLAGGYGNEKEYEQICHLAKNCVHPVHFLGKLTQQELAKEINRADIFVLPSFYEGLPLVILEAMACGANVICSDLPGIQDWMDASVPDHGIAFVQPPKMKFADEPEESDLPFFEKRLAETIMELSKHRRETRDVSGLSWDHICKKILEIQKKIENERK